MGNLGILSSALTGQELLDRVRSRVRPDAEALEEKAAFLKREYPEHAQAIVREADRALEGQLVLPGTMAAPRFVGDPPDWYSNPVHDNEYVWSLNRMRHWEPLLRAHAMTGEARYATKVVAELSDWIETCPRPALNSRHFNSVDPWRSLEVGIRMFEAWPRVLHYLVTTPFFTPDLMMNYAVSLHEHGQVLSEISPLYFPKADHNHYLMEMLGLFTLACTLPELKNAERWRDQAIRELDRCAAAQITEDGGQIEGCPSYHNGCVYWFLLALVVARASNLSLPDTYADRVRKTISYTLSSIRPSGTSVPWGDSDADRHAIVPTLYAYLASGTLEPLQMILSVMPRDEVVHATIEHLDRVRDPKSLLDEINALKPAEVSLPRMSWQKELKQVMMRTDWGREAASVFFACRTPINNAHAHVDPMGFDYTALGRPLVVDPGRFTYRDDEDRKHFKSAKWHNTLLVDDREPFEYMSSWRYGPQAEGTVANAEEGDRCQIAEAVHYNYKPTVHKRALALADEGFLLVLDQVSSLTPDSSVQIYYHIDSTSATLDATSGRVTTHDDMSNVTLATSEGLSGTLLPGRVSDEIDMSRASTRVRYVDDSRRSAVRGYATLIVPFDGDAAAPEITSLRVMGSEDDWLCEFGLDGLAYQFAWDRTGVRRLS